MESSELLIKSGRDSVIMRNLIITLLTIAGILTLVIGWHLINVHVFLTLEKTHTDRVKEPVNYAPPDWGGPGISFGCGTR